MALRVVDEEQQLSSPVQHHARDARHVKQKAREAQEAQYAQQVHQIQKLQRQLNEHDDHLGRLTASVQDDGRKQQVEERVAHYYRNPREIAPEDALDTIVRLENQLKLQQRQNQLRGKELEKDRRHIADRRNVLLALQRKYDEVMKVTGWDGRTLRSNDEQLEMRDRIDEMATLAKRLREEHRAAQLIIHKKEHVVEFLNAELAKRNEQREQLDFKYNEIRVADRDNRELQMQIQQLRDECERQDNMIVEASEGQDTVALECLRDDNEFLKSQIADKKERRARQQTVMRRQADRLAQLTRRFEVLGGALRDLGMDRRAAQALSAVPPAIDAVGEPDDLERIQPTDEQVPTCVYELLIRDMASIRSAIARKDVMVVEKECVVQALQEKLAEYEDNLRFAREQEAHTKDDKFLEMEHLRETLRDRHREYRHQIDRLLQENIELKEKAAKRRQAALA